MAELVKLLVEIPKDGKSKIRVEVLDSISADGMSSSYRVIDCGYVSLKPRIEKNAKAKKNPKIAK